MARLVDHLINTYGNRCSVLHVSIPSCDYQNVTPTLNERLQQFKATVNSRISFNAMIKYIPSYPDYLLPFQSYGI
jgi:hypothetical protein